MDEQSEKQRNLSLNLSWSFIKVHSPPWRAQWGSSVRWKVDASNTSRMATDPFLLPTSRESIPVPAIPSTAPRFDGQANDVTISGCMSRWELLPATQVEPTGQDASDNGWERGETKADFVHSLSRSCWQGWCDSDVMELVSITESL